MLIDMNELQHRQIVGDRIYFELSYSPTSPDEENLLNFVQAIGLSLSWSGIEGFPDAPVMKTYHVRADSRWQHIALLLFIDKFMPQSEPSFKAIGLPIKPP